MAPKFRLCTRCGKEPSLFGKQRCHKCTNYGASAEKSRRQQRIDDGICVNCPKPSLEKHTMCKRCLLKAREDSRKRTGAKKRYSGAKSYQHERDHTGRQRRSFARDE